jgi:hypothetical protein
MWELSESVQHDKRQLLDSRRQSLRSQELTVLTNLRVGGKASLDGANDTGWKPLLLYAVACVAPGPRRDGSRLTTSHRLTLGNSM